MEESEDDEKEDDYDDNDDLVAEVIDSEARESWKKPRKDCNQLTKRNKKEGFFQKSYLYTNSGKKI